MMSWGSARSFCEEQGKRLPTKDEALKEWKYLEESGYIWTSAEKDSLKAFYLNLRLGALKEDWKSNEHSAFCVCPASECSPSVLKKKNELHWEPVKIVTAAGGLKMREGPSVKSRSFCTVPEGTVLKISERADQKETIDGTEGVWMKAGSCGKSGWFFGGYLCSITEEGCNDYHDFINTFK